MAVGAWAGAVCPVCVRAATAGPVCDWSEPDLVVDQAVALVWSRVAVLCSGRGGGWDQIQVGGGGQ